MKRDRLRWLVGAEWFLGVSVATGVAFLLFGARLLAGLHYWPKLAVVFAWLFVAILGSALAVVRHAELLAERLGEPFGTLILTLSVTSIEVVSISAVMLHGANNPTLARDTLFAVTMIILNGMVGLSLLLGGWRHREQQYNLQGANAYLGVIIPLGVLALVLPNFTMATSGPTLKVAQEMFLAAVSVLLYAAFLALQARLHRNYFDIAEAFVETGIEARVPMTASGTARRSSVLRHAVLLGAYLVPVVYLAEKLAVPVDYVVETSHAPIALAGFTMAVLVATPEAISAVRAAGSNRMQRSVNIFLGSVLSTIGLTIPAVLAIGWATHSEIILGLQHTDLLLFLLTLALCMVTFSSGRTNVLQGGVHLVLFATYLFLMFQG